MIIKNADVVLKEGVKRLDIRVENGVIAELAQHIAGEGIDCTGLTVLPGLIDMHVHLREPGFEKKEDIASGSAAAVKGGFTQICCMPNTRPVTDNKVVVSYILNRAREVGLCKVHPIGAITEGQKGENLAAIGAMKAAGAVALSEDGKSVANTNLMANAMLYAADFGLKCLCHCEDASLVDGGVVNEGYYSTLTGLKGSIRAAEDIMIAREICLAESLSLPVHICHVSTYSGVQLIREAKARGVQVTAETCPHYFTLTDEAIASFDTNTKVNPPLREEGPPASSRAEGRHARLHRHRPRAPSRGRQERGIRRRRSASAGWRPLCALLHAARQGGRAHPLQLAQNERRARPHPGLEGGGIAVGVPADLTIADLNKRGRWTPRLRLQGQEHAVCGKRGTGR